MSTASPIASDRVAAVISTLPVQAAAGVDDGDQP